MMTYISVALREEVRKLANGKCEYCLRYEAYTINAHEVDHIRPEKHRGETIPDNLCLSCLECNRYKGSNLCSIDPVTDSLTALYNPRMQRWDDHFQLQSSDMTFAALTPVGRVTILILELNDSYRVSNRLSLARLGVYPDPPEEDL